MRPKPTESTSETVQDDLPTSSSFTTVKMIHSPPHARSASLPSSPISALPSPPDSPSGGSVSSLPSIGSSFFYSSAAASPPYIHAADEPSEDYALPLVIPSLTLPAALPHPSPYGETLGDLKLLILGSKGIGKTTLANLLLESNDDIVHVSGWEGNVLTASTDWLDHEENHGLEKFEPAMNVQIAELPGYDPQGDVNAVAESALDLIHAQFLPVYSLLNPDTPPCPTLINLLSSPYSPFYTALIILTTTSPTHSDTYLVERLSPHIPVIALPPFPSSRRSSRHLSSFRPANSTALRSHLFRSPETLVSLRMEAADRFLRWREVHRVHNALTLSVATAFPTLLKGHSYSPTKARWNKSDWETEWDYKLSKEVFDLNKPTLPPPSPSKPPSPGNSNSSCAAYYAPTAFDPLHLPSIFMFSLSLLSPLRYRIFGEPMETLDSPTTTRSTKPVNWGILGIVGAFCAGIGLGVLIAS